MFMYITSGTYPFLKKIQDKYTEETMLLLQNPITNEIWHETSGSTVFNSPRKFEIIGSEGNFLDEGFVSCHYISVKDEHKPIFEFEFYSKTKIIKNEPGFIATRFLRPLSSVPYIIMVMWDNEKSYKKWQDAQSFQKIQTQMKKNQNIFSIPSHTKTFILSDEELEDPEENESNE